MDVQKEREAFEAVTNIYHCIYNADLNYYFSGSKFVGDKAEIEVNAGWKAWQAAKAQAVPEWVSVEDKLPIDGQDVIAFDAIKHCVFKGGEFLQWYIESDTGHEYEEPVEVTHWMAVETQEPAND